MVNEEILRGSWQEIRGKLRSKWGQITDDELQQYSGNLDDLVGTIQRKTGESQEAIRGYLNEITSFAAEASGRWTEQAGRYATQAADSFQGASRRLADSVSARYGQAEELMQRRPIESVLTAFGIGLVAGLLVALTIRSR